MSARADAGALQSIALFAECDRTHLQVLAFSAGRGEFANGETIVRQGERGEAAHLILQGLAEPRIREGQTTRSLGMLEPGAFVGELAMIAGLPYAITVTAASRVVTARIDRQLFMRVAREFPDFGARVHAAMARKLDDSLGDLRAVKRLFDEARPFQRR